jgi:hypothetical protein
MDKTLKFFRPIMKGIDEESFSITALVSDQSIDRDSEVVLAKAWKKGVSEYKKHPVLVAGHAYGDLRKHIGEATKVHVSDEGLETKFKYYAGEGNPEADWAWKLAQKGKAMFSVGFIAQVASMPGSDDWDDTLEELKKIGVKKPEEVRRVFTEVELLEISQVLVGSNRNALQTMAAKSVDSPVGVLAKEILDEMGEDIPEEKDPKPPEVPTPKKCEFCGAESCNCLIVQAWIEGLKKEWASELATIKLELNALTEKVKVENRQPEPAHDGAELLEAVSDLAKKF